ncbi:type II toxin-antitoxin system ParD family antitoxin [Neorhizobium sp. SOG26]|uniref:type II toxin-antitoxin system ParD family antitoxin n=1 Tax=Neorhizobium sp. SOG26 TaxID=2060726 RepID=UPI000E56A5E8|nr:type II toxin-antitoxin system ParD family antitoxin [Neorhizobium sp. SOG26]AXV14732.1 type II toxin-antitoxin system ParD family antitoxin [Neorhizobium sp. SOG26]
MASSTNLGQPLEDYVDGLVKAGRFESRDDVLREGIRLLQIKERRQAELDAVLDRGLADIEAGRFKPLEEVAERLKAKYTAMKDSGQ